jgi:predicted TIM-barrel fold metal-dependent hydrolase
MEPRKVKVTRKDVESPLEASNKTMRMQNSFKRMQSAITKLDMALKMQRELTAMQQLQAYNDAVYQIQFVIDNCDEILEQ